MKLRRELDRERFQRSSCFPSEPGVALIAQPQARDRKRLRRKRRKASIAREVLIGLNEFGNCRLGVVCCIRKKLMDDREALVALNMIPHVGPVRLRNMQDRIGSRRRS
jgi:hypothetical protein